MEYMPDALDFRYLLIEYYKKIGLSETDLAVLMVIDHLLQQGNTLITADLLQLKMSLITEEIDAILVQLLSKGFLEFDNDNNVMKTTIKPLRKRLFQEFQMSMMDRQKLDGSREQNDNIFVTFQKELGRSLSPVEIQRIREWISYGYADKLIIDALKEAIAKNKKSIRSIDKILLKWSTSDDMHKEGYSAQGDQWKQDIDKTIAIAKAKWLEDDDE